MSWQSWNIKSDWFLPLKLSKSKGQKRAWVSPSKGEMMSPDKGYQGSPLLDSSLKWSFFRLYPHTSLNISKLEINYSSWCHIIKLINPYFTIKDHQHQRWRSCGKGFWSPGGKTHKVTVSRPTIWSDLSGIWYLVIIASYIVRRVTV